MSHLPYSLNRDLHEKVKLLHAPACLSCGCVQYDSVALPPFDFIADRVLKAWYDRPPAAVQCRLCGRRWLYYRLNFVTRVFDVSNDPQLMLGDL